MQQTTSLEINHLDLLVHLGWTEREREEKQMVRANIQIHFAKTPKACQTDHLQDTFCYADMIEKIIALVADKKYRLIEYLAEEIHRLLKSLLQDESEISISIIKHPAISQFAGNVCFTYRG